MPRCLIVSAWLLAFVPSGATVARPDPTGPATAPVAPAPALVPAFPGAEGFGRYARGGRGGAVLFVTHLGDSGPGSLRAAVEATGPRTVVFAVSGTIALRTPLVISQGAITIAGQSAPGDGITLRDQPLVVSADDVVLRFIRSRLGDVSKSADDAIWIAGGRRVILDHVSASWSEDETLSVSPRRAGDQALDEVTVQWSFITESLNHSAHPKGAHGYGSLVRGSRGVRYSFHHNLWAHHRARMPRPGNYASASEDPLGPLMDFRNNVFRNWGDSIAPVDGKDAPILASGYNADADAVSRYNFINNDYRRGPDSKAALAFEEGAPQAQAWFAGNRMDGVVPTDPWQLVGHSARAGYPQPEAFPVAPVPTTPAALAPAAVLRHAGASHARDAVDRRVVRDLAQGGGRIIDSQEEVGGWPVLLSTRAPSDRDRDGVPDAWEKKHGGDPARADSQRDADGDGYTALEDYLNALVRDTFDAAP